MNEVLHLETRKKIYKILLLNPGLNLSTIAEQLSISVQLADYHLHFLEENGLITTEKEGGYKRYYIQGKIGSGDKKILSLFYREIPLKIVLFLLKNPHSKPKEIRKKMDISPALLTYYLKKLIRCDVIAERPGDEKKRFVILNEKQVIRLLIRYRPNILLERFKDTWVADIPLSGKISEETE